MTPLLEIALLFTAGDVIGLRAGGAPVCGPALIAALALLSPGLAGRLDRRLVRAAFALLGIAAGAAAARAVSLDCRNRVPDGAAVTVTGLLDAGAQAGGRATIEVSEIRVAARRSGCERRIRLRMPEDMDDALAGNVVRVTGNWWRTGMPGRWPQAPDRAGTMSVRSIRRVRAARPHPLSALRRLAFNQVRKRFGTETALAESLLLARRESLDPAVAQDFAAAGLSHLLAISGAHVGILTAMVLLGAGLARMTPRAGAVVATTTAVAYVILLGAPAAAARAVIQGIALLASRLTQRPSDRLTLLAAAGLVLIGVDPMAVLGAGFQLSFAGVFGLLMFGRPIARSLPAAWPRPLVAAVAPTLAATAATAPIAAWHFGLIAFIGPVSNLAAAPVLALAIPAMVLSLGTGLVVGPVGQFLAGGAEALLALLRHIATVAANLPGSHAWVAGDAVTASVVAAAVFLLCGPAVRRNVRIDSDRLGRRGHGARLLVRSGVATCVVIIWPAFRPGGGLEIHAIDVGQGDAFAIHTPADQWILIDTGPASDDFDAGRQRVAPWLRAHGARRIDVLVLTHPHMDHIGGARALLDAFHVNVVVDPAVASGNEMYIETLEAAARSGGSWVAAEPGREIDAGRVVLRVLAPDSVSLDAPRDPNDFSVVVRLEYGRFGALFLGDAPRAVEDRIVARYGSRLASQVLKVGHHGSRSATGDSLLRVVRPQVALIPVGRRNRYGHPDPGVLDRLHRYGVRIVRTDESGSVIMRVRPDGSLRLFGSR